MENCLQGYSFSDREVQEVWENELADNIDFQEKRIEVYYSDGETHLDVAADSNTWVDVSFAEYPPQLTIKSMEEHLAELEQ